MLAGRAGRRRRRGQRELSQPRRPQPNVRPFGARPRPQAVAASAACGLPLWVKLSPNVADIVEIAGAALDAGAEALVLVNTVLGMAIDVEATRPTGSARARRRRPVGTGHPSGGGARRARLSCGVPRCRDRRRRRGVTRGRRRRDDAGRRRRRGGGDGDVPRPARAGEGVGRARSVVPAARRGRRACTGGCRAPTEGSGRPRAPARPSADRRPPAAGWWAATRPPYRHLLLRVPAISAAGSSRRRPRSPPPAPSHRLSPARCAPPAHRRRTVLVRPTPVRPRPGPVTRPDVPSRSAAAPGTAGMPGGDHGR